MDFDRLAAMNVRLSRAREAFHEALIMEREASVTCSGELSGPEDRKPVKAAQDRVRRTAEEYDDAVEEFARFTAKRSAAGC